VQHLNDEAGKTGGESGQKSIQQLFHEREKLVDDPS
jgi:hypothetical protein